MFDNVMAGATRQSKCDILCTNFGWHSTSHEQDNQPGEGLSTCAALAPSSFHPLGRQNAPGIVSTQASMKANERMSAGRCHDGCRQGCVINSILPCLTPELIAFRIDNDLQRSPGAVWNDIVAEQNLVHSHSPSLQSCQGVRMRLTPLPPPPHARAFDQPCAWTTLSSLVSSLFSTAFNEWGFVCSQRSV